MTGSYRTTPDSSIAATAASQRYKNTGIYTFGNPSSWAGNPRTIVVLGVARSGTSIVSGALHHLGVFTGDLSKDPVYEDVRLSSALQTARWHSVEDVIRDYNDRFQVWAYKRPNIIQATQQMGWFGRLPKRFHSVLAGSHKIALFNFYKFVDRLRNPIFIVPFKDIFAISNRNRISMNFDLTHNMHTVWRQYGLLLQLIQRPGFNSLLVSVDKIIHQKDPFLAELISFCGLTPTAEQEEQARRFITADPERYHDVTRATKSIGYLDEVSRHCIHGWARYLGSERVATVILYIDEREVARTKANVFRQDLLDNERHSRGECAFRFENLDANLLNDGCEIRVRVSDDERDLANSPHILIADSPLVDSD